MRFKVIASIPVLLACLALPYVIARPSQARATEKAHEKAINKPIKMSQLLGRYGLNWKNELSQETCVEIDEKLLKDFRKHYKCDLKETDNSESGMPHVKCTHKNGTKEYLIFKTQDFCNEEREAQTKSESKSEDEAN